MQGAPCEAVGVFCAVEGADAKSSNSSSASGAFVLPIADCCLVSFVAVGVTFDEKIIEEDLKARSCIESTLTNK